MNRHGLVALYTPTQAVKAGFVLQAEYGMDPEFVSVNKVYAPRRFSQGLPSAIPLTVAPCCLAQFVTTCCGRNSCDSIRGFGLKSSYKEELRPPQNRSCVTPQDLHITLHLTVSRQTVDAVHAVISDGCAWMKGDPEPMVRGHFAALLTSSRHVAGDLGSAFRRSGEGRFSFAVAQGLF
jgi:hypothetical protein